jgi:hypothetical protein
MKALRSFGTSKTTRAATRRHILIAEELYVEFLYKIHVLCVKRKIYCACSVKHTVREVWSMLCVKCEVYCAWSVKYTALGVWNVLRVKCKACCAWSVKCTACEVWSILRLECEVYCAWSVKCTACEVWSMLCVKYTVLGVWNVLRVKCEAYCDWSVKYTVLGVWNLLRVTCEACCAWSVKYTVLGVWNVLRVKCEAYCDWSVKCLLCKTKKRLCLGQSIYTSECHFSKTLLYAPGQTHFQSYPHNAGETEWTKAVIIRTSGWRRSCWVMTLRNIVGMIRRFGIFFRSHTVLI